MSEPRRGAKVAVVGDAGLDVTFQLTAQHADEKRPVERSVRGAGGTGANVAATLAALGTDVVLHASVGDDGIGKTVVSGLARAGVDVSGVRTLRGDTEIASIVIEPDGRREVLVSPGVGFDLAIDGDAVASVDVVVMTHVDQPIISDVRRSYPSAELVLALEGRYFDDVRWASGLHAVGLVLTNESGDAHLARSHFPRPRRLVVTRGERGATVWRGDDVVDIGTMDSAALDATGAGDAFCAATVHFMSRGFDLVRAAGLGAVTAGLAIRHIGAQRGLPTEAEVLANEYLVYGRPSADQEQG